MNPTPRYWKNVPAHSLVVGLLGVFLLFSTIGFAVDVIKLGRQPLSLLAFSVISYGVFAILYAVAGTVLREKWWKGVLPIFVAQNIVMNLLYHGLRRMPQTSDIGAPEILRVQHRLNLDAFGIMLAMVIGYVCFVYVFITEGRRYFRVHAEIELASEIHRTLVPTVDVRAGGFEFYGRSVPSGEVGGDLIDVHQDDRGWIAYVADVSGHGVAPGVVMAMVKSAARMRLAAGNGSLDLLECLNSILCQLTRPEMFCTFAYLASTGGGLECAYSLAGHPAILHYRAATKDFSEITCSNLPLGMFDHQSFGSSRIECASGDLFLLLTDGVLEVENASGEEFGFAGVQQVVLRHAHDSTTTIFEALLRAAQLHGKAGDDQSVLVVRCLG